MKHRKYERGPKICILTKRLVQHLEASSSQRELKSIFMNYVQKTPPHWRCSVYCYATTDHHLLVFVGNKRQQPLKTFSHLVSQTLVEHYQRATVFISEPIFFVSQKKRWQDVTEGVEWECANRNFIALSWAEIPILIGIRLLPMTWAKRLDRWSDDQHFWSTADKPIVVNPVICRFERTNVEQNRCQLKRFIVESTVKAACLT